MKSICPNNFHYFSPDAKVQKGDLKIADVHWLSYFVIK